jgi:Zn-dependent protease
VLIGEPPRSGGDINFQLFGIPVRIHPFFWLIAVLLGASPGVQLPELLIWVTAVFLSILIHELGHALTMRAYGIWPWITLYSFGGLASYNPSDARRVGAFGQVLISLAGPGAQFLLVALLASILYAIGFGLAVYHWGPVYLVQVSRDSIVVSPSLTELLDNLMAVSVLWGVLNLLPVYPLDGGQIAREIFTILSPRNGITQSLILSMVAAVCMAVVGLSMRSFFMALMFGLLAYGSYATLQAYRNQRGW